METLMNNTEFIDKSNIFWIKLNSSYITSFKTIYSVILRTVNTK